MFWREEVRQWKKRKCFIKKKNHADDFVDSHAFKTAARTCQMGTKVCTVPSDSTAAYITTVADVLKAVVSGTVSVTGGDVSTITRHWINVQNATTDPGCAKHTQMYGTTALAVVQPMLARITGSLCTAVFVLRNLFQSANGSRAGSMLRE